MEFIDEAGNRVTLFEDEPVHRHVLVIPRLNNQFVLTHHKNRGIEFPGGKVEAQEDAFQAAHRELFEETGCKAHSMKYIASYKVHSEHPFIKDVFAADISEMIPMADYMETYGPVLMDNINDVDATLMSPLLKDACIQYIVQELI